MGGGFYQDIHPAHYGRKEILLENVGAKEGRPFSGKARGQGATQGPPPRQPWPTGATDLVAECSRAELHEWVTHDVCAFQGQGWGMRMQMGCCIF